MLGDVYIPSHFEMSAADTAAMLAEVSTVDLVSSGPSGLMATFLPVLYDPDTHSLLGHVARTNEHWRCSGMDSMAIVHGPDAYVSPSAYAAKAEHGRVVPTWNYTVLHLHGTLTAHEEPAWLRDVVTRLTQRHEADLPMPWSVSDAPAPYIEGQLRAIVGIRLTISRVEAKSKLSQNRAVADRDGVINQLERSGADVGAAGVGAAGVGAAGVAAAMRRDRS